jgi:ubiquinone/menaquinone biosynthesis C-methylase UbiE
VLTTREREYYDKVAKKYSRMISSGIGAALKRNERDCLMRLLSPRRGQSVLDVGCGSGFYANLIRNTGAEVFCVDISPEMVSVVRSAGMKAEVHDVESLNLEKRFDKILCAGPLEFCRQPSRALENLRCHLSREGCIVLSVLSVSVMGFAYWLYHMSHGLRINLFSLSRIAHLLEQADFTIEAVEKPSSFMYVIRARVV